MLKDSFIYLSKQFVNNILDLHKAEIRNLFNSSHFLGSFSIWLIISQQYNQFKLAAWDT